MCCSDPPSGKGLAANFGVWAAPASAADLYHRADLPAVLPAIVAEQGGDRKNHPFSPEPAMLVTELSAGLAKTVPCLHHSVNFASAQSFFLPTSFHGS